MAIIKLNLEQPEKRSNPLENPQIPLSAGINTVLSWGLGAEPTPAGEIINEHLAEQFWAVYTAIRLPRSL